jgi:hypothetical protein
MKRKNKIIINNIYKKLKNDNKINLKRLNSDTNTDTITDTDTNTGNIISKKCRQEYYDHKSEKSTAYILDIY